MLRPLYERGHDCIEEFERAAAQRHAEAIVLDKRSRKLAAIYLFGYSVEMRIKSLYFYNAGFGPSIPILVTDRASAVSMWQMLGLPTKPGPHDILGWAQLAVAARATTRLTQYGSLGTDAVAHAQSLGPVWSEVLRYRCCEPRTSEWKLARSVAQWFGRNYDRMK
jgi:hypothetical protein